MVEDDSFQRSSALLSDDRPSRKVYPNPTEFARGIGRFWTKNTAGTVPRNAWHGPCCLLWERELFQRNLFAVGTSMADFKKEDRLVNLPLYAVEQIAEL